MVSVLLVCLFCGVLQLCSAQSINCTVTYSLYFDQTTYSISDVSRVSDVVTSQCQYSWTGNNVLANHKQHNTELVVTNSVNELITSKCFDKVTFVRSCISERVKYTATCATNCTLNALQRTDKPKETDVVAVAAAVVAALMVLVVLFLYCKCRKRFPRVRSCSPVKYIYTVVKMQHAEPRADDVDAGQV